MRRDIILGGAVAVGSMLLAQAAVAVQAQFPTSATKYRTTMVRAMDQCVPSGVSIPANPADPAEGCLQANIVTDDMYPTDPLGSTMDYGVLSVSKTAGSAFNGRVRFFGTGFRVGQRVKVRLTLRATRTEVAVLHPPGSHKRVTFADVTVECGNQVAGCFSARPNGAIVGSQTLKDCLTTNGEPINLRLGNVEILDAAVVNCDTGKVLAVPGIKQTARGVR